MSGIYIHIPFCKQACHYCDFHFSTSLNKKDELISALKKEIRLRKDEFKSETVETIYFGGGTPSLLTNSELESIIQSVYETYKVAEHPEITLEANPDDLSKERLIELSKSPINRLSIGIQSFFEADLNVLQTMIDNSSATINMLLDDNEDGIMEPVERGYTEWVNGRLVVLDCF